MAIKPGTDYTKTADRLTNPVEVRNLLIDWEAARKKTATCQLAVTETEEGKALAVAVEAEAKALKALKDCMELNGSYQSIEEGLYAVIQKTKKTEYLPDKVKELVPDLAPALLITEVNVDKFTKSVKAGLITAEVAAKCIKETAGAEKMQIDVLPADKLPKPAEVPDEQDEEVDDAD